MDRRGNILKYGKRISGWGFCRFRVGKNDPVFVQHGDIVIPMKYGVQITRGGVIVWQGMMVDNGHRTKNYVDIEAFGYLYRLSKLRVKRDAELLPGDGKDNYRVFSTGTMASAVQDVFNEAKTRVGPEDILSSIDIGSIDNPDFPDNFTKADNTPLVGGWEFSSDITLQFDYMSVFYVLNQMGLYSGADMEITDDLQFNFKTRIGNRQPGLVFSYGRYGNCIDYDAPRLGKRTVNDLMGIASDNEGNVLHINERDEASIGEFGLLEDTQGFLDVKGSNALRVRLTEQLRFISTPYSVVNMTLSEKAYPLGQWGLGDTGTYVIDDGIVQVNQERRITGYSVTVHNTGKEIIIQETNPDRAVL